MFIVTEYAALRSDLTPTVGDRNMGIIMLFCLLLLPLWESVIILCFVVRYRDLMSIAVLQSS